MTDQHPLTARFTTEEYRLLERARLRFRCRSLAELLHDAACHYVAHRRDVIRPTRTGAKDREEAAELMAATLFGAASIT